MPATLLMVWLGNVLLLFKYCNCTENCSFVSVYRYALQEVLSQGIVVWFECQARLKYLLQSRLAISAFSMFTKFGRQEGLLVCLSQSPRLVFQVRVGMVDWADSGDLWTRKLSTLLFILWLKWHCAIWLNARTNSVKLCIFNHSTLVFVFWLN